MRARSHEDHALIGGAVVQLVDQQEVAADMAFRLMEKQGKLPAYEEDDNARRIRSAGIPGFDPEDRL